MSKDISKLIGQTLKAINQVTDGGSETITALEFMTEDDKKYRMYHEQACCENVYLYDICGDLDDLIGAPILEARLETDSGKGFGEGSETWSFYELRTIRGSVTLRWYGESNGYYSETVEFREVKGEGMTQQEQNIDEKEENIEQEIDEVEEIVLSKKERTVMFLRKIINTKAVWYISGILDGILVILLVIFWMSKGS